LFQLGDEAASEVGAIGGARPSLLEVVQRGAGVEQRISEPAIATEQCGDVVTGQPGPLEILAGDRAKIIVSDFRGYAG
jgi:hypothetical protein